MRLALSLINMKEHFKSKKIGLIILTLLFILLATWSLIWSWAEVITVRAEKTINKWEQQKAPFNNDQAQLFEKRLLNASVLQPNKGQTHLMLARLYTLYLTNCYSSECIDYSSLAEERYNLAVMNSPTWEYAWARIANFYYITLNSNKHSLVIRKKQLIRALTNALRLGTYEDETQKLILPLLFEYWDEINQNSNKAYLNNMMIHIFKFNKNSTITLNLANNFGLLSLINIEWLTEAKLNQLNQIKSNNE